MQVELKNFKLGTFRSSIDHSLIVDKQFIFEFSTNFIRSVSYSPTKSFLKLVTMNTSSLCSDFGEFPTFDLYILRGDLFKKFLSVYTSDEIDIVINLTEINGRHKATQITITGKVETGNELKTQFVLSTEDMLTNKVDDFASVINGCTPSASMMQFILSDLQIQEIKRLIKKLHKASVDNSPYLTFTLDSASHSVRVNDKVFDIKFDLPTEIEIKDLSFNILKSDFVISGNQTFTIYVDENDTRILFGATQSASLIWCLLCKVNEDIDAFSASVVDSSLDSLDFDDLDDLF